MGSASRFCVICYQRSKYKIRSIICTLPRVGVRVGEDKFARSEHSTWKGGLAVRLKTEKCNLLDWMSFKPEMDGILLDVHGAGFLLWMHWFQWLNIFWKTQRCKTRLASASAPSTDQVFPVRNGASIRTRAHKSRPAAISRWRISIETAHSLDWTYNSTLPCVTRALSGCSPCRSGK